MRGTLESPSRRVATSCATPSQRICYRQATTFASRRNCRHSDVSTTMIYTHAMNKSARGVTSSLDRME